MARQSRSNGRSSGFGSSSRSSSFSSRSASPNPSMNSNRTQQPVRNNTQSSTPVQAQPSGGMMGGIGSTIVSGMAFGAGSEVAHQAVRSLMGGNSHQSNPPQQNNQENQQNNNGQQKSSPCSDYNFKFVDCLKANDNNISTCQTFFDDLKSCEKSLI